MSILAKTLVLSYDSAVATKTSALKTSYRSVRLIKDSGAVTPPKPSYVTNVLLCGNCIDPEKRNLYVFYIDTYFGSAWIIEINIDSKSQVVVYYDKTNTIGFDPLYKIRNPRVVHGRLIWTDNKNPIYQMDIERAKKSYVLRIGYGQYPNTTEWSGLVAYGIDQIVSNGNRFYKSLVDANQNNEPKTNDGTKWETLCLIEDAYYSTNVRNYYLEPIPPTYPPVVTYRTDESRKINNLRQTLFQFAYRYVYMDWRKSTFSPASIVPVPQAEEETATGLANEQISLNNKFQISVSSGGEEVRAIEVIGRSSADPSKWFLIETLYKFEQQERGNELSITSNPPLITMGISVLDPTIKGTNIVDEGETGMGLAVLRPSVMNTYVASDVVGMQWTSEEFGISVAKALTIDCNPLNATLTSRPDWLIILSELGYSLLPGMTVHDEEVLLVFPPERPTENLSGYIVFTNSYGDSVTINVSQAAPIIIIVPITPVMLIDPEDSSGMEIRGSLCGATSNNNVVTFSLVVSHPAYEEGDLLDVYWRAVVTRNAVPIAMGNGVLEDIVNINSNTGSLTLNANLVENDQVIIYLSAQAFVGTITPRTDMSMTLLQPNPPINSGVASEKAGMQWLATESGVESGVSSEITCPPQNCTIISKPDWLTIRGVAGYDLYAGWTINNGESIVLFPTDDNLGLARSGYVVLTNAYGDSVTLSVSQAEAGDVIIGTPVICTLQNYSGDTSGLTITGTAYALSGNKNIVWSALVGHSAHADESWTMYWRVKVNGIVQGSGSFDAYVGSNTGELIADVTLQVGDVVLIDFSSIYF